jgi:hypothetical protein
LDDGGVCFSPAALAFLGAAWVVIQGVIVFLFRGWLASLKDQIASERSATLEARAERDRVTLGWERTLGLGETVVRREQRKR